VRTEIQFFQYNPFSSNVDVIQLLMSDPVDVRGNSLQSRNCSASDSPFQNLT